MTVIDGIESLELNIRRSEVKYALVNNEKIEDKLNVIMVISNPCSYKRRWVLAHKFIKHMREFPEVELCIVELAYGEQMHRVAEEGNVKHLQLRTSPPLWHKENIINIGVHQLLPKSWKALDFENIYWASDILKILK